MPVLNECYSNDAEGFVYVGFDLDMEPEPAEERIRRRSSVWEEPPKIYKQISSSTSKTNPTEPIVFNGSSKMAASSEVRSEDLLASSPTTSELNSICHLRTAELFPKRGLEVEVPGLVIPFTPICGESVQYLGRTQDGVLGISNYRIFHRSSQGAATNIPLMLVETADVRDIFYLHVMCKDARSLRCTFASGEQCMEWQRRISSALLPPDTLEKFFAFSYKAWAAEPGGEEVLRRLTVPRISSCGIPIDPHADFRKEVSRLQFDMHGTWRVSEVNINFQLCPSYPPLLLVPVSVTDQDLETVARFRSSRRIPAVVWRHKGNGAIIARCSQPEVGWLGWRSNEDEQLVAALAAACHDESGANAGTTLRKLLIIDARSYASAVTNRARGGGCECPQYYPCAEIQFMCLPNIHSVRKSFQALRALAAEPPDHANWHSVLEKSLWLQAVGGLLRAATLIARAVHVGGRPTLVHCSDGWDRTPQIVSTAQLLLDPYYRTCEGFRILVEREWLDFGHKFADRCGHTVLTEDLNERCPVFLQWLDCVHQILVQYPCSFEFSQAYLIKLAQHAYSCLFGTFLCNSRREREHQKVTERTFSVWNFLRGPDYHNHLYEPNQEVLYPAHSARALVVWSAVYLGVAPDTPVPAQPPVSPPPPAHATSFNGSSPNNGLTKTRSYQDLSTLGDHGSTTYRRCSDPNIHIDPMKRSSLSLSGTNSNDSTNNNCEHSLSNSYPNDILDSDILDKESKYQKIASNSKRSTSTGVRLINTTIPKQIINGYSYKTNGNIVPVFNNTHELDKDTNFNSKQVDHDIDSISAKFDQNSLYENGNGSILNDNILTLDSPDQIDGREYIEQAIDTIAESQKMLSDDLAYRSGTNSGLSPMEDSSVFCQPSIEFGESCASGRTRSENWRSESECSQQTDSSCVDLAADMENDGVLGTRGNSLRRQRLDSVQNGGLNDSAATLLETEIGNLISAEKASNSVDQTITTTHRSFENHRRNKSDGANASNFVQYYSLPLSGETSDMTLCPNSPFRTFYRTQSVGASSNISAGHSHVTSCLPDNLGQTVDGRVESCCLNSLHHNDYLGCTASHHHCLLHCITHCTHRQSNGSYIIGNAGPKLDPVDGLICPQSPVQHRLHQIIQDHKMIEEALRKELLAARLELQQRACRTARPTPDHASTDSSEEDNIRPNEFTAFQDPRSFESYPLTCDNYFGDPYNEWSAPNAYLDYCPQSDSSSLAGDGNNGVNSAGGSTAWMEGSVNSMSRNSNGSTGNGRVLWVPDHAVSRCTRCETPFWLGKRKHHCRSCGRIFCAECSEKTTPIPNEQLYNPVRVCTECYASLSNEDRNLISEQQANRSSQIATQSKKSPVTSSTHSSSAEVRPLSDYCKQVSGDQKLNTSPVTAASN